MLIQTRENIATMNEWRCRVPNAGRGLCFPIRFASTRVWYNGAGVKVQHGEDNKHSASIHEAAALSMLR